MIISYFAIAVFVVVLIALLFLVYSGATIAPWLPSRKHDFERVNRLAGLEPGQTFYELGCGDGRVARYIATKNPETEVIGIEIFFPIYLWAKGMQLLKGPKNLKIKFGDALKEDLTNADVIYTFALTKTINGGLKTKFEQEMKQDARILSYVFAIKEWDGVTMVDKPDKDTLSIYTYTR
ncbi:MAG: hypothetical protein ABIG66_01315 [Candidatus Kerfeldbacteria bacterium]